MWRRDVCLRPEWDWGSKPEYWERKAADAQRGMESTLAELKAAGWSDAEAVGSAQIRALRQSRIRPNIERVSLESARAQACE